jgi:uncharacterized protein (DUF1810 family)
MEKDIDLERFLRAQESTYETALSEISQGRKRSHWMWYTFPQIAGLGFSETAVFYSIKNESEARAFMQHPVLGMRLIRISRELLNVDGSDAAGILGYPDDLKLRSSMTLFASLPDADPVFKQVLDKFFGGTGDPKTLKILRR